MVLISDEYCTRCGENRAVYEERRGTIICWKCIECEYTVDMEYEDDEEFELEDSNGTS